MNPDRPIRLEMFKLDHVDRNGNLFVVRADEILNPVAELQTAITRVRAQFDLMRNNLPDGAARGVSKRLSGKCSN